MVFLNQRYRGSDTRIVSALRLTSMALVVMVLAINVAHAVEKQDFSINPEMTRALLKVQAEQTAWSELILRRSMDANLARDDQNVFAKWIDMAKWLIPGYSTIKISYVPVPFFDSILMGSHLDAQRRTLLDFHNKDRTSAFNSIMDDLIKDNPSIAVAYSEYLGHPSYSKRDRYNILSGASWLVLVLSCFFARKYI